MLLRELTKNHTITLASLSPRRRELLEALGIEFTVECNYDTPEDFTSEIDPEEVPQMLSLRKSLAFNRELLDSEILITADTLVICDFRVLGKPANRSEALSMLRDLSGKSHKVVTGVTIRSKKKTMNFSSSTNVFFREMSDEEIAFYVDNYAPYDKAGAYGVQEWIGITAIHRIEGSYYNVVGLPVQKLGDSLKEFILS